MIKDRLFSKNEIHTFLQEQGYIWAASSWIAEVGTVGTITETAVSDWFKRYFPSFRAYSLYQTAQISLNKY